jgi:hypothetical protein
MLVSFVAICIGVGTILCVSHLIFFDWYAMKKERETKEWLKRIEAEGNSNFPNIFQEISFI